MKDQILVKGYDENKNIWLVALENKVSSLSDEEYQCVVTYENGEFVSSGSMDLIEEEVNYVSQTKIINWL